MKVGITILYIRAIHVNRLLLLQGVSDFMFQERWITLKCIRIILSDRRK